MAAAEAEAGRRRRTVRVPDLDVELVIGALKRHGDLDLAGGPDAVRAVVQPRARLDAGKDELADARANMPSVVDDPMIMFSVGLLDAQLDDPAAASDGAEHEQEG